jgi:nitroimidazol reductase NimA-like FMN-containing flavoprotein (pyridoxamine 5'-phosphate oxidase superfamily)
VPPQTSATPSDSAVRVRRQSAWSIEQIEAFLSPCTIPLRIACNAGRGFPSLNSMWFEYSEGSIWCATHASSAILGFLQADPRCAFEVAPNEPPYCGVRGQAKAELTREGAADVLQRLIARYLGDSNPGLSRWLMSRVEDEWVIRLEPIWFSAWDYRARMPEAPGRS